MSIRIRGLSRVFDGRTLFEAAALDAPPQGLVALRGPNGSGKTTLLRILSTLTSPSRGDAEIAGRSVLRDGPAVRTAVGLICASDQGFYRRLSGEENLLLFGAMRGIGPRAVGESLDSLTEILPALSPALRAPFGLGSAGMRQALSIARALLHGPRVILADEPTRSLDEASAAGVRDCLRALAKSRCVLVASHASEDCRGADQLWEFRSGQVT